MNPPFPRVAYLTAGAAGMFCGSCMRDNTLAAALHKLGCDVHLIPTYTPIRTDEPNVAEGTIFYGGINVFLQEKSVLFRYLPRIFDRWLDQPWLLDWLSSRGIETDARFLGELTLSMLRGEHGRQRKEVRRLVDWLARDVRPELVNLSNVLIGGCIPAIKKALDVPVLVTLQGDDLFLDSLPPPYRERALAEIRRIAESIDGYIVFCRYYADHMAESLGLDREKFHIVPMGLNLADFSWDGTAHGPERPPTVGYFARVCPAKGLHLLIEAMGRLRSLPGMAEARLLAAGWLGPSDREYFESQRRRAAELGFENAFHYAGVLDRTQKLEFFRSIDVLSVPTTYREPKGLYVLEALASGVPVVQPAHGAFPEMLAETGGGLLVEPHDPARLADGLFELLSDEERRRRLGREGREAVRTRFSAERMAEETLEVYGRYAQRREPAVAPAT